MTALLRYAFLKTARQQLLYGLLLAPTVIFLAPLLGIAVLYAVTGRTFFPFTLEARMGPRGTSEVLCELIVALCSIVAGTAAFRVFRDEIAGRGLAAFYLVSPPRIVAAAATLYGALVGMAAYLTAAGVLAAVTTIAPDGFAKHLAIAAASVALSAALGALAVGISSDQSMLLPVYAGGFGIAVVLLEWGTPARMAMTLVGAVAVMAAAQLLWGRRCAV